MRMSIIVPELKARDAIGNVVVEMAKGALINGWDCRIYSYILRRRYVPVLPEGVSLNKVSLGELLSDPFFINTDVIVYHYAVYCPLMESIKATSKPCLVYFPGITPPDFFITSWARAIQERSLFGLFLMGYADIICVNSDFIRKELLKFLGDGFPRPVHVLPLFVDLRTYSPGPKDRSILKRIRASKILLFVGRVINNKRIDVLVQALPLVKEQYPGVKLVIIGDWTSSEEYRKTKGFLEELARDKGVKENVVFMGSVKDVVPFYRTADLFLTASEHEGFCMPIVEAMACGTPVIAANASAIPETLGGAGVLFTPGNHVELAQKIIWLLSSEDNYRFWREKGLTRAQDFSLEKFYSNFMKLVNEAVNLNKIYKQTGKGWIDLPFTFKPVSWAELQEMADIALRDYRIRSHIPVIGRLIELIRFHLTSHVKEAYLDPIIEKQVMFNYQVVRLLYELNQKKEEK